MNRGKRLRRLFAGLALVLVLASCERIGTGGPYSSPEGIYTCQESSVHSGVRKYFVEVDPVRDADDLYILCNFHNQGENDFIYARYANDSMILENQVIRDLTVNGKGPVSEDFTSIILYYTTDDGITQLDFAATMVR